MHLRSRRVYLLLSVGLMLAGCGGSDPDPDPAPASTPAEDVGDDGADSDGDDASSEAGDDAADGDVDEGGAEDMAEGAECPDGPRELDGVSVMTFHCGPATASVTTSGGTTQLSGGTCEIREDTFAFNLGTVVLDVAASLDGTAPAVDYVGIAVHEGADGDGTFDDLQMVTVVASLGGEDLGAGSGTVTLRDGRTAGDATADDLSIEFACG